MTVNIAFGILVKDRTSCWFLEHKMSREARKRSSVVLTSSDINRSVQSQKQARSLKFWI